ncbi:MAG: acyl-CoA dehydrogenase family protein, partial [Proteobacteria bacterium]|nr:acyl-CoA dehydrogenase family protein [Pseudomonadota bacterium]
MFQLSDTQIQIRETARRIAIADIAPRAAEIDRTEEYPWDNVGVLVDAGFMGMTLPRELGGQGASLLDAVLVIEEMARVCGVTGRIVVEA